MYAGGPLGAPTPEPSSSSRRWCWPQRGSCPRATGAACACTPVGHVPGLLLLLAATAFTLWARVVLGTMWSMDAVAKQGHELRTDGPYAVTRRPIYTGMLGMLLGSVLLAGAGRALLLVPVGLVFFEVKLHLEERLLSEAFPQDYARYRRRVPQLVPGLRPRRRRQRAA